MKRTFLERRRSTGGTLILRGVINQHGCRLVIEEASPQGELRSVVIPITEIPSLIGGCNDVLRWWRDRNGTQAKAPLPAPTEGA